MPLRRLLVLMIGNFLVATSFMSVGALLPEIAASLRISIQQAGLLIAAFGISAAVCAPVLATAGSRIDRRLLLTISMAICALANLLAAFSRSFEQLLWLRVLAAVTSAVYTPQVAATLSLLVPEGERATTLVKLMMGWTVGQVVGTPLSVLIADAYGWRAALAWIGGGSAIVAVLVWHSLPAGVRVPPLSLERWYQVFESPALRWLTAATALTNIGSSVLFSYLAPIVKAVQGISGAALSLLLLTQGVGGVLGNLLSVRLVRSFGAANVAYKCNLSSAAVLLLWPLAASWAALIYAAQFLWSLGGAGFPAVQQARLVAVAPPLAAATIALNSSCTYLGGSLGAAIGSLAWPRVAPRYLPWFGLVFILGALACSVCGERAARAAPVPQ
jgi:MFS transporter, DHA1 family, inner membrane transport protein